jgi:precorrin-3B synthase
MRDTGRTLHEVKGWCPGALRPMLSGDGWLVRVRPRRGRLSSVQATAIADLADACGSGVIEVSRRANIQIRGVAEARMPRLIDGLAALALIDRSADVEARRNIVLTPFSRCDDASEVIADALARALSTPDAPELPAKFGFAVDCEPSPVLRTVSADIRIESDASGGLLCRAHAASRGARATITTAAETAMALAAWFVRSGGAQGGPGRMAAHLARGASLPAGFTEVEMADAAMEAPRPGVVATGVLVGVEFGQIGAQSLAAIADLGALRITPWRMLLIEGLDATPNLAGVITRRDDPMLRVVACTGAPRCPQALQATRPLARALAPYVGETDLLHVSGCGKGCAHSGASAITLVGRADGFDLIRNGRVDDVADARRLDADWLNAHAASVGEAW